MINFFSIGKQMYRVNNWREAHRLIVFTCRSYLHYPVMEKLYDFFQDDTLRRNIIAYNKYPLEQATRAFFYKDSTFHERSELIMYHFTYLQNLLKPEILNGIYHDKSFLIWKFPSEDTDWKTVITSHSGQRKEGLVSLEMLLNNQPIYQMMFWLNKDKKNEPSLWIGAMQGPNQENAQEIIKETTKLAHRYRTKNLILYMTMAVARALKAKHIYAVSNEGYYAMNHVRRDRKLKTDFGAFWQEPGGHITEDSRFYEIPLIEPRKEIEEVPTRKRAVYRRRFAFQDDVDLQITKNMKNMMKGNV